MPTLHVLDGPDKGRTFEASGGAVLIGRSSQHVSLTDTSASRRHAAVRPVNGHWVLIDLNSSNGTYLNGRRVIHPAILKYGDHIRIGLTVIVFQGPSVDSPGCADAPTDVLNLADADGHDDWSIPSTGDALEESVILSQPATADAITGWNVVCKVAESLDEFDAANALLERVADILFQHVIADRLIVLIHDRETDDVMPYLARHRYGDDADRGPVEVPHTIIRHVLDHKEGVLCTNALTDERFCSEDMQNDVRRLGPRSIICVPIVVDDVVRKIIQVDCATSRHTYTQEQLRLVTAIARVVGLAIQNMEQMDTRVRTERLAAAGEAVAYLSHSIRNILQGLQGAADVAELAIRRRDWDKMRTGWHLVRHNLDRIYSLTMNMLTFCRERQPRIRPTRLNRIVQDVIDLVAQRVRQKGITLVTRLDEVPPIPTDPDGVHQVIHNILLNALDAVEGHAHVAGRVSVVLQRDNEHDCARISIRDNGPGIPPDEQIRVFSPFHSSKGHGGTGLGLPAAKKIVEDINGSITVASDPGRGTVFHVSLPLAADGGCDISRKIELAPHGS